MAVSLVKAARVTHVTSREVYPSVLRAMTVRGHVISDAEAATIAAWYHSPAERDIPLVQCGQGSEFDPDALLARVGELIKSDEFKTSDSLPELHALQAWCMTRVKYISVSTLEVSHEDWLNEAHGPDDYKHEVCLVSEYRDDLGEWMYPGDPGYPEGRPEALPEDGSVWVSASVVTTASELLKGHGFTNGFYAAETSGSPWFPGNWYSDDPYHHPYTGEVTAKTAHLHGFTPKEEAAIYALVMPEAAARDAAQATLTAEQVAQQREEEAARIRAVVNGETPEATIRGTLAAPMTVDERVRLFRAAQQDNN